MTDYEEVILSLQGLGVSGYEAKAYVALMAAGKALTGYEVAKRSGVPRSTVYETLGKLVARGAVFEVRTDPDTVMYVPLSWDALLRRMRREYEEHLDVLASRLPAMTEPSISHVVHQIEDRGRLLARATDLIEGSDRQLHLWASAEELGPLASALNDAEQREVKVVLLRVGGGDVAVGRTVDYEVNSDHTEVDGVRCRLLLVVSDRDSVLMGAATPTSTWGLYTEDPAVVLMATERIRDAMRLQLLVDALTPDRVEELFSADADLELEVERSRD